MPRWTGLWGSGAAAVNASTSWRAPVPTPPTPCRSSLSPTNAVTSDAAAASERAQLSVEGPTLSFIAACPPDAELFTPTSQPAADISPTAEPAADTPTEAAEPAGETICCCLSHPRHGGHGQRG